MAEVPIFYLGSSPVEQPTEEGMVAALRLLMAKLDNIQKKTIDRIVEKKYKTRLSSASPVYQKVAAKLKKKGLDCTNGEKVLVEVSQAQGVSIRDPSPENELTTRLPAAAVVAHAVLDGRDGQAVLGFVQKEAGGRTIFHALNGERPQVELLKVKMSVIAAAPAAAEPAGASKGGGSLCGVAAGAVGGDDAQAFGAGLKKIQRKRTVNLKGSGEGGAKRTSSSYGKTFASLGAQPPGAEDDPGDDGGDDLDDDDLLAGVEEDMFGVLDE